MFDNTAPNIELWTILISPRVRATVLTCVFTLDKVHVWQGKRELTIISTALPNVAFSSAPTTSPATAANSSVALLKSMASGRIPNMLVVNTNVLDHSLCPPKMPNGTKTSSSSRWLLDKKLFSPHHSLRTCCVRRAICVFVRRRTGFSSSILIWAWRRRLRKSLGARTMVRRAISSPARLCCRRRRRQQEIGEEPARSGRRDTKAEERCRMQGQGGNIKMFIRWG